MSYDILIASQLEERIDLLANKKGDKMENEIIIGGVKLKFPRMISENRRKQLPPEALLMNLKFYAGSPEERILSGYWSDYAFLGVIYQIQMAWLIRLLSTLKMFESDISRLKKLKRQFTPALYLAIKEQEETNPVKAVQAAIRKLLNNNQMEHLQSFVGLGIEEKDILQLAYAITWKNCNEEVARLLINLLTEKLEGVAVKYADSSVVLGNQITTVEKELAVYAVRLEYALKKLNSIQLRCTLSSTTFLGLTNLYPEVDWLGVAQQFMSVDLNLVYEELLPVTECLRSICDRYQCVDRIMSQLNETLKVFIDKRILNGVGETNNSKEFSIRIAYNLIQRTSDDTYYLKSCIRDVGFHLKDTEKEGTVLDFDSLGDCALIFGYMYLSTKNLINILDNLKVDNLP